MRGRTIAGWMWLIVLVVVSVPAVAQQNDVPILRPKKPQPKKQSGAKIKHVATAKILEARHTCTK